jgi:hypothetical protein
LYSIICYCWFPACINFIVTTNGTADMVATAKEAVWYDDEEHLLWFALDLLMLLYGVWCVVSCFLLSVCLRCAVLVF